MWSEEQRKAYNKKYKEEHKEQIKEYNKVYKKEFKDYCKEYSRYEVNSFGKTKSSIRSKSRRYLLKYGQRIKDYEIHHCYGYNEPYKFIYCSRQMHILIHSYLRQHNIDVDSNHYDYIKHLLDNNVVLYGI